MRTDIIQSNPLKNIYIIRKFPHLALRLLSNRERHSDHPIYRKGVSDRQMIKKLVKLTKRSVEFFADRPIDVGAEIDLEIKLPEGVWIKSFVLHGTVNDCKSVRENGSDYYLVNMKIGDLSALNQTILTSFMEFLERDCIIKETRRDFDHLQETLTDLKKKFIRLAAAIDHLKTNAQGVLELIKRNRSGKTTLH